MRDESWGAWMNEMVNVRYNEMKDDSQGARMNEMVNERQDEMKDDSQGARMNEMVNVRKNEMRDESQVACKRMNENEMRDDSQGARMNERKNENESLKIIMSKSGSKKFRSFVDYRSEGIIFDFDFLVFLQAQPMIFMLITRTLIGELISGVKCCNWRN